VWTSIRGRAEDKTGIPRAGEKLPENEASGGPGKRTDHIFSAALIPGFRRFVESPDSVVVSVLYRERTGLLAECLFRKRRNARSVSGAQGLAADVSYAFVQERALVSQPEQI
jgi:hypothetical protein